MSKDIGMGIRKKILVLFLPCLVAVLWGGGEYGWCIYVYGCATTACS